MTQGGDSKDFLKGRVSGHEANYMCVLIVLSSDLCAPSGGIG